MILDMRLQEVLIQPMRNFVSVVFQGFHTRHKTADGDSDGDGDGDGEEMA